MDPRIVMMVMQARMQEQVHLQMQRRLQLEAQIRQGMTEEQRVRTIEHQQMRMMMLAAQRGQMMAEHIRMAGNGAEGLMPSMDMPFPRGPLFFPGQMGGLTADPRNHPPTGSSESHSISSEPSDSGSNGASPRAPRAGIRNGRPGVIYGEWEVEDSGDEK